MKKFKTSILLCICIFNFSISNAQKMMSESAFIQSIWGESKTELITNALELNRDEAAKFLPIYNEYTNKHLKLGSERIQLMNEYVDNMDALQEETTNKMAERLLKNNQSIDKLQMEYYKKITKKVSITRAIQFLQIELYIQSKIRMYVQDKIPFVENLEKKANK